MSFQKLDLHPIFNDSKEIDTRLNGIFAEAHSKKLDFIEIIPGKGSGQLKAKVLRFLNRKDIKAKYSKYDVDNKNFGRIFVHFNWKKLLSDKK